MQEQNNKLSIPAAIIFAGLLIAVGIVISNTKPTIPKIKEIGGVESINFKALNEKDHIIGNLNSEVVILEYSDTECPFCKMFHSTMHSVISSYKETGKVSWVYRHFPIDQLHSKSRKEAEATECANELGGNEIFWKYIDMIYQNTSSNDGLDSNKLTEFAKKLGLDITKFNNCLSSGKYSSTIQSSIDDANAAGANGTPYSLIISKNKLSNDKTNIIKSFVEKNQLTDQYGNPYIYTSKDDKIVVMNGNMPVQIIKTVIDIIIK